MASPTEILGLLLLPFWYFIESFFKTCQDLFVPVSLRNLKDLSGEVALVTGGGAGLGRSLAIQLAELKVTVVTWDINQSANEETVRMILDNGGSAYAYTVDIGNPEDVYAAAEKVKGEVGEVTLLVNNAAIGQSQSVWEIPDKIIQKMMTTNALAYFWLLRAFLPSMKENNHGHIVAILSGSLNMVPNGLGAYISSKSAAYGLHQALNTELLCEQKTKIQTTVAFLDFIATDMTVGRLNCGTADVLPPQVVAHHIIEGIRLNIPVVTSTKTSFMLYLFKNFIPTKIFLLLFRLGGVTSIFLNTKDKK
ncbi:estradiol 17-beta-dehydrogenase 11-like [Acanthaster planci]|uniref:Estradiol 17-beta-dehydrogenase 11-like n=1 Tax=Acanthaster planci TaxID=133434 RepID=A0A8B7YV13_ACAPL|nr:estradiol 17-beta-dehydrogenase 11-like [Acanthaster planci]